MNHENENFNEDNSTSFQINQEVWCECEDGRHRVTILKIKEKPIKKYKIRFIGFGRQFDSWCEEVCLSATQNGETSLQLQGEHRVTVKSPLSRKIKGSGSKNNENYNYNSDKINHVTKSNGSSEQLNLKKNRFKRKRVDSNSDEEIKSRKSRKTTSIKNHSKKKSKKSSNNFRKNSDEESEDIIDSEEEYEDSLNDKSDTEYEESTSEENELEDHSENDDDEEELVVGGNYMARLVQGDYPVRIIQFKKNSNSRVKVHYYGFPSSEDSWINVKYIYSLSSNDREEIPNLIAIEYGITNPENKIRLIKRKSREYEVNKKFEVKENEKIKESIIISNLKQENENQEKKQETPNKLTKNKSNKNQKQESNNSNDNSESKFSTSTNNLLSNEQNKLLSFEEKIASAIKSLNRDFETEVSGRKNEIAKIETHIFNSIEKDHGTCIYISGKPGTGKSQTVTNILKRIKIPSVYIDCIGAKADTIKDRLSLNLNSKTLTASTCPSVVLILDEVEHFLSGDRSSKNIIEEIMYWTTLKDCKLIVIGIANKLDFRELPLSDVSRTYVKLSVIFEPYVDTELEEIVNSRLRCACAEDLFAPKAIKFLCWKIATGRGDARSAIDITQKALKHMKETNHIRPFTISDFNYLLPQWLPTNSTSTKLDCLTPQQKTVLMIILKSQKTYDVAPLTVDKIRNECRQNRNVKINPSELNSIISVLLQQNILSTKSSKQGKEEIQILIDKNSVLNHFENTKEEIYLRIFNS